MGKAPGYTRLFRQPHYTNLIALDKRGKKSEVFGFEDKDTLDRREKLPSSVRVGRTIRLDESHRQSIVVQAPGKLRPDD